MRQELRERILEHNRVHARNRQIAEAVEAAGGIRTERVQSDKLGFDWERFYVNDILVRSVYTEQPIPMGTAEHPIPWEEGMALIQNAYYTLDSVRKVWMGQQGTTTSWDDPGWEAF